MTIHPALSAINVLLAPFPLQLLFVEKKDEVLVKFLYKDFFFPLAIL